MRRDLLLMATLFLLVVSSGCAATELDAESPANVLDAPGAERVAVPEPPAITDQFEQYVPLTYAATARPRFYRPTVSLGFIGDDRIGVSGSEPPSEGPWYRPFPGEWTSSYRGADLYGCSGCGPCY